MVRHFYLSMIILVSLSLGVNQTTQSIYDLFTIKHGIITSNETWSGKIIIAGDVIISKNCKVQLKNDTWLVFNDSDMVNYGKLLDKAELIIYGTLEKEGDVAIMSIRDKKVQNILNTVTANSSYLLNPAPVDPSFIEQQIRDFKIQYLIGYALVYSMSLVFL